MSSDEDVITSCQRGDIEGLAALIRRHQADALRQAYLLTGDRYLAEDIVQESFLHAYAAMPRFRTGHPFRPWFHQIVTDTTRMYLRSAPKRRETSITGIVSDAAQEATGLSDSAHAERMEDRAAIGQALVLLTRKQREAVAFHYYFA